MSAESQTALLQEHLDQSWMFRAYAHLKHGLGLPNRNVIGLPRLIDEVPKEPEPKATEPAAPASVAPAPPPVSITPPAPAQPVVAAAASKLWPIVTAAALGLGGIGAGLGVGGWFSSSEKTTTIVEQLPGDGDLLFELSKRGYNLPPAGGAP